MLAVCTHHSRDLETMRPLLRFPEVRVGPVKTRNDRASRSFSRKRENSLDSAWRVPEARTGPYYLRTGFLPDAVFFATSYSHAARFRLWLNGCQRLIQGLIDS